MTLPWCQSWVFGTGTVWSVKPKIFTVQLFIEKFPDPYSGRPCWMSVTVLATFVICHWPQAGYKPLNFTGVSKPGTGLDNWDIWLPCRWHHWTTFVRVASEFLRPFAQEQRYTRLTSFSFFAMAAISFCKTENRVSIDFDFSCSRLLAGVNCFKVGDHF